MASTKLQKLSTLQVAMHSFFLTLKISRLIPPLILLLLSNCSPPSATSDQENTPSDYTFGRAKKHPMEFLDGSLQTNILRNSLQWEKIVIHSLGEKEVSLSNLERHHKKILGFQEGVAWHFLIGDGSALENGEIYPTNRWEKQLLGKAFRQHSEEGALHICLLGKEDTPASKEQLKALDELLTMLLNRHSSAEIYAHSALEPTPRPCPGEKISLLHWQQLEQTWPTRIHPPKTDSENE